MLFRVVITYLSLLTRSTVVGEKQKVDGLELLNLSWSTLKDQISSAELLVDTSPQSYMEECFPPFMLPDVSMHDIIDLPSGLCMGGGFCGFEQCWPKPEFFNDEQTTLERGIDAADLATGLGNFPEELYAPSNPYWNIPPKVLFPMVAGDVVAAITFAKNNNLEVSIKNSGHNYVGASSKKDTLLINMNKYTHYAAPDLANGLLNCEDLEDENVAVDLSNQPCMLAKARGKPAVVRVGGGENFDKLYRAVNTYNKAAKKYHLVGGAAGTVSPQGWSYQGGLSGTTAGRMFGFGVDQILSIEAVLPNGFHVKFGPTGWVDDNDNYIYPRTIEVSGVCNQNPSEEESKWVWSTCPEEIDFGDLWYAMRGGGGGTWGVVLSLYLQLHDYLPLERIIFTEECMAVGEVPPVIWQGIAGFVFDFMLQPDVLNVTEQQSNACGCPGSAGLPMSWCYGVGSGDAYVAAYKRNLLNQKDYLTLNGVSEEVFSIILNCLAVEVNDDYAETILIPSGRNAGKADDNPKPSYVSGNEFSNNILIPMSYALENRDLIVEFMAYNTQFIYLAFGGMTKFASDQYNSLSDAHRNAALMVFEYYPGLTPNTPILDQLTNMYDFTGDVIPAYIGSNHLGPNTFGPLKNDLTTPCPNNLAMSERESQCVSAQEVVFGSEVLSRLESIKETIDPDYMFNCFRCVGNKIDTDKDISSPAPVSIAPITAAPVTASPIEDTTPSPVSPAPIEAEPTSTSAGESTTNTRKPATIISILSLLCSVSVLCLFID